MHDHPETLGEFLLELGISLVVVYGFIRLLLAAGMGIESVIITLLLTGLALMALNLALERR